jgi:outer membrane protein assembly factor BamB
MKQVLLLLGMWTISMTSSWSQEQAQWRGPNRDGIYPETGLLRNWPESGPPLLWHFDGLGSGHSSVAVAGEKIYTAGIINGIGNIFCFSMEGKLLWKVPYGEEWTESWEGVRCTPCVFNGKIYLLSGMGKLLCRSADDGKFIWSVDVTKEYDGRNIRWGYTENLAIDGNSIFCTVGGITNNVIAVNRNTGKLIWSGKGLGEASAYCSPAIIKLTTRTILVTQTENHILCLDATNGTLLWSHEQPNKYSVHANTPIFLDGFLFCSSGYGQGSVMLQLKSDGTLVKEVWRNTAMDNKMGGYVLLNGKLYGSDDSNTSWHCLDWKTGKELGSAKITGKGNIICADGMLYCYSEKGEIVLALPGTNVITKVSGFNVPDGTDQHWAHLVIAKGRLFVRHGNSLMVYNIKKQG